MASDIVSTFNKVDVDEYVLGMIEELPPPPAKICPTLPPKDSSAKFATCVSV